MQRYRRYRGYKRTYRDHRQSVARDPSATLGKLKCRNAAVSTALRRATVKT